MPIFVRSEVRSGVGYFWIRPPFDPYLLTSTGAEISTDNTALIGEDSNHVVTILGRVEGKLSGIILGNDVNQDSNETVRIGATGYVYAEVDGIHIDARNSNVRNEGTVVGRQTGIELNANVGTTRLINSGTILSDIEGIRSTGAQTLIIENTGMIYGQTRAIATFGGATAIITNTGEIVGEIYLDAGNDVYNGVNGRLSGPITCFGGNDTVNAGVDNDIISGMGGNDILNGGLGADRMDGGADNDTFYVDNIGDVVVEGAGGGTADWVASSISYTLAAGVQAEKLSATNTGLTTAIDLTGNEFVQAITGNAGANRLNGAGGADTMTGLGGNDTYYVDNAGDKVVEGAGQGTADWVATSVTYGLGTGVQVELLSTTSSGGTTAINISGNEFGQTIVGNAGANLLTGKGGDDTLTGAAGADVFFFDTTLNASTNVDRITDFNVAADTIRLENGVFTQIVGTGTLTSAQFVKNTTGLAQDASDHIIYETDTGKLFYDSNGSAAGGSIQFATLAPNLALTNWDFHVV